MFSIESPHRGDSNECTQYTIFNIKKITLYYSKSAAMGFCSKGLKKDFESAVTNEPSVFEPLKVYCVQGSEGVNYLSYDKMQQLLLHVQGVWVHLHDFLSFLQRETTFVTSVCLPSH